MAEVDLVDVATIIPSNIGWHLTTADAMKMDVDADHVVKINTIIAANVDETNDATVDIHIAGMGSGGSGVTDGSGVHVGDDDIYIAKGINVPAGSSLVILSSPIYMMERDTFNAIASADGDIDLFVSFEILDDA
tara:strand:+ start:26 stop:427 length:402 start_codon:yes stop_codon:yes gene_type:complete